MLTKCAGIVRIVPPQSGNNGPQSIADQTAWPKRLTERTTTAVEAPPWSHFAWKGRRTTCSLDPWLSRNARQHTPICRLTHPSTLSTLTVVFATPPRILPPPQPAVEGGIGGVLLSRKLLEPPRFTSPETAASSSRRRRREPRDGPG
jgi:hypothetical protein